MKKFLGKRTFLLFFTLLIFAGCKDDNLPKGMKQVHWDRDVCERCYMMVSEKKFGVQVVDPKTDKSYMFDDLGCAVLWFKEEELDWFNRAKIFINDAKTGEWIDAREASYLGGTKTPMNYGFSAFSQKNKDSSQNYVNFDEAVEHIKIYDKKHNHSH